MLRKTFDTITATVGLLLAAILLTAGGLLTWGSHFVGGQVHDQLVAEQIVFPSTGDEALTSLPASDRTAMEKYAGQTMTTGEQAGTYANHFIRVHLSEIGGGQTYSQLSAKAMQHKDDTKLQAQVATVFKGETLRGLLLNAYAWGKTATIMGIAAVVSFAGGGILLVLSGLGFAHRKSVQADTQL